MISNNSSFTRLTCTYGSDRIINSYDGGATSTQRSFYYVRLNYLRKFCPFNIIVHNISTSILGKTPCVIYLTCFNAFTITIYDSGNLLFSQLEILEGMSFVSDSEEPNCGLGTPNCKSRCVFLSRIT